MAISRCWRAWKADFAFGSVPILKNGDLKALAHFTGQFSAFAVFQFAKMAISRRWRAWQADFCLWRCSNSQKWRFQGAGALGRLIFAFGGVPILKNGDLKALAHFTGQFSALAVFQFSKIPISRRWRVWQADFCLWQCSNSQKWRLEGASALHRPIFGLGGVPILKNSDFKALARLAS